MLCLSLLVACLGWVLAIWVVGLRVCLLVLCHRCHVADCVGFVTNRRLLLSSSDAFGRVMYSYKVSPSLGRLGVGQADKTGTGRIGRVYIQSIRPARYDGRCQSRQIPKEASQQFKRGRQCQKLVHEQDCGERERSSS